MHGIFTPIWSGGTCSNTLPIKNKDAVINRNTISQVLIRGYTKIFHTDHAKKFANKELSTILDSIDVKYLLSTPYHLQNQGAIRH